MRKGQRSTLTAILAVAIALAVDPAGLVQPAQAQRDDEKKRKQQGQQRQQRQPQPGQRATQPPQSPPKTFQQKPLQQNQQNQQKTLQQQQPPDRPRRLQQDPPPAARFREQPRPGSPPDPRQDRFKRLPPSQPPPVQQGVGSPKGPPSWQKGPSNDGPPNWQKTPIAKPAPGRPDQRGPAFKRFDEVRKGRIERVHDGGRLKVTQEPGNTFILRQGNRIVVRSDAADRFRRRPGARSERRADGTVETFYVRRDGVRIVTVVDANGRLLRRYRRYRDGRERNIIDNRRFYRAVAVGVGIGVLGIIALNLPPPRITIPRERYIVDYDSASDDDLFETLDAPPIEDLDRAYSIDEIRDNYELRARVRSVDIDTIYFEFGSWEIPPDEHWKLERIARAILRVLDRNSEAVFLVAAHTDAVGSDEDNASLSSRRATAVADVLTDVFDVPEENLVTQGYGEQYLKIDTPEPEPRNRRVSVQNVTALMAER